MCAKTQLYARKSEPGVEQAIEKAKAQFERRRCGHHPDTYAEPLSAHECVLSVVDPKGSGAGNKHRYVCAINDDGLRASLRQVPGVPLIFIRRSVVLMEPMAHATARVRSAEERGKFRAEIKRPGGKRKRDVEDEDEEGAAGKGEGRSGSRGPDATTPKSDDRKKRKPRGPKEPNPLSVKKKKKPTAQPESTSKAENHNNNKRKEEETAMAIGTNDAAADQPKKKRKRKHKSGSSSGGGEEAATTPAHGGGGEGAPAITALET